MSRAAAIAAARALLDADEDLARGVAAHEDLYRSPESFEKERRALQCAIGWRLLRLLRVASVRDEIDALIEHERELIDDAEREGHGP